ncbi:hypothetical protein [Pseudoxanthomonas jiangsuensis]|nr:hypothetical protein [Pseudoxanthomonas jiangsuensis]
MGRKTHFSRRGGEDYLAREFRNLLWLVAILLGMIGLYHLAEWLGLA